MMRSCGFPFLFRNCKEKCCSFSKFGFEPYPAAVTFDYSFANGKADSGPGIFFFGVQPLKNDEEPFLADALDNGGVYPVVGCRTKPEVLQKVVLLIPGIGASDKELIFKGLMARESLGSTAVGNGIAIPHVRNPIVLNIKGPSILLCFLETPIDFSALDGKKVTTMFTMISPTARVHLHLLARLSYVLQNHAVRNILTPTHDPAKILSCIREVEKNIPLKTTGTAKK
jgi:mannitol/fructose-specific phosphotransferase system IIA component (Ntr-type)